MANSATDHTTEAQTGCSIGHIGMDDAGFGFPNKFRQAAVTALTGFQSAIARSHAGCIPWVGTNALEMAAIGNVMMRPIPWADSGSDRW